MRDIITDDRRMDAAALTGRLRGMCLITVATATADGRPLTGPFDGYFLHGSWWFSSGPDSVRVRHLKARPAVSMLDHYLPKQGPGFQEWMEGLTGAFGVRIDARKLFTFAESAKD